MKIPAIKQLVQDFTLEQLQQAEKDLLDGKSLSIEVQGEDDGEQLTHILAGIWIHEQQKQFPDATLNTLLRLYAEKVRKSID